MVFPKGDPYLLVHLAASTAAEPASDSWGNRFDSLRAYADWASGRSRGVRLLVPEPVRERTLKSLGSQAAIEVVGYRNDKALSLPSVRPSDVFILVNGQALLRFDFDAVLDSARACEGDVTVFGPDRCDSAAHYEESVSVDDAGQVLHFRRLYDDSPSFADHWSGDALALATTGEHIRTVTAHVLARGWGLDSIGALSRRLAVRWTHERWTLADSDPALGALPFESGRIGEPGGDVGTPRSRLVDAAPWPVARESISDRGVEEVEMDPAIRSFSDSITLFEDDELVDSPPRGGYEFFKRAMDIIVSATGLLLLAPFLLVVAALVKVTSPGPLFFTHRRQGRGGKEFPCLKFRSMAADAHEKQASLRKLNQVDGPQFKIDRDPRQTKLGTWLRRFNIDEVPQLFNVLVGQMSLVGPRPSPDGENQMCPAWRRARLSVRPGVTGLWQVLRLRENPDTDFQEWIYYDVEYAKHRTFWLDLLILVNTPIAMFKRHHLAPFVAYLKKRGICAHAEEMGWKVFFPPAPGDVREPQG